MIDSKFNESIGKIKKGQEEIDLIAKSMNLAKNDA